MAHNNAASPADEYLKFLLGAVLSNVPQAIRKSAARGAVRLAAMHSSKLEKFGFRWEHETLVIRNDFPLDIELLRAGLEKMARALYFHHYNGQKKLLIPLRVLPLFIPLDKSNDMAFKASVEEFRKRTIEDMELHSKFGGHPDLFAYQIFETQSMALINMEFYGAHHAAVVGLFQ